LAKANGGTGDPVAHLHLRDLTPDPQNAREHTPANVGMIVDALHEVGAWRSIAIDEDNVVIAGNATVEAAAEAGIVNVRVVEATGNEIIAVRRTGLTAEQKRRAAIYDNRAAELARWHPDVLAALHERGELRGLFHDDDIAIICNAASSVSADAVTPPAEFPAFDDSIQTGDGQCPRCGLEAEIANFRKAAKAPETP
jgi:hypothetical protein